MMIDDDVDPEFVAPETGEGAADDTIARAVRRLRLERAEVAALDERFSHELDRVNTAWKRARQPIEHRIESLQAMLAGWLRWRQAEDVRAGRRPKKSEPFPDGRIQSRVTHRVEILEGAAIEAFPDEYRRTKVEVDRKAIADDIRSGAIELLASGLMAVASDGVDPTTGEVLPRRVVMPARWVEDVSITITTTEGDE